MTIFYLCSAREDHVSGGVQKLFDHVALLQSMGFAAQMLNNDDVPGFEFGPNDMVVIPEVFGDGIRDFLPKSARRRVCFVQNSYLIEVVNGTRFVKDPARHPLMTTPELEAILTESQHTEERLRERFPDLTVPLIRTHSSGNGRFGKDAGFSYGPWPRDRKVIYFGYKHEKLNAELLTDLALPSGWTTECLTGLTNTQIQDKMRTAALFVAANYHEGMCAPTSEAMISGCAVVCWTGGGPDEYLVGRSVIAPQDDMAALRWALIQTAHDIDEHPERWARDTREWSDWFQATYSRQGEIDELRAIWEGFGFRPEGPRLHVGYDPCPLAGWEHAEPTEAFGAPESASKVFVGHVLEHLEWADLPDFLGRVYAVLQPGGETVIVGPDVYRLLERWRTGAEPWWLVEMALEGEHGELAAGVEKPRWNSHEARVADALKIVGFTDLAPLTPPPRVVQDGGVPGWPAVGWAPWQYGIRASKPRQ